MRRGLITGFAAWLIVTAAFRLFGQVFPSIPGPLAAIFAALMLWGYGLVIATIVLFGDRLVAR